VAQRVGERQECAVERDDPAEDVEQFTRALGRAAVFREDRSGSLTSVVVGA